MYKQLLAILIFMSCLGASKAVFFNDGSSFAKYLEKSKQLTMIHEEEVQNTMESHLFGDGLDNVELEEIPNAVKRQSVADNYFFIDKCLALLLVIFSTMVIFPKLADSTFKFGLLFISLWFISQSFAMMMTGGKRFSELAIPGHAARWGLPVILFLVILVKDQAAEWSARVFASLTFFVHGWEAWCLNPPFQDLLFNFFGHFNYTPSSRFIAMILHTVGVMDICLAVGILLIKSSKIYMWMAFWGFVTAFSRPLTLGFGAWSEFAIRAANGGIPLWLFLSCFKMEENQIERYEKMEKAREA